MEQTENKLEFLDHPYVPIDFKGILKVMANDEVIITYPHGEVKVIESQAKFFRGLRGDKKIFAHAPVEFVIMPLYNTTETFGWVTIPDNLFEDVKQH